MDLSAISKTIKELQKGERTKIAGTVIVVDAVKGCLKIDDGTGMVDVVFKAPPLKEKVEAYNSGDQVIIIGHVKDGPDRPMEGEIIRKTEGFDSDRYRQVLEVWKDVRSKIEGSNGSG